MKPGDLGLLILRLVVGLTFAAHGGQKAFGWWSGSKYAGWRAGVERMGLRPAGFWAIVSTAAELGGGVLLAVGFPHPPGGRGSHRPVGRDRRARPPAEGLLEPQRGRRVPAQPRGGGGGPGRHGIWVGVARCGPGAVLLG
jgi:hypothetical protein